MRFRGAGLREIGFPLCFSQYERLEGRRADNSIFSHDTLRFCDVNSLTTHRLVITQFKRLSLAFPGLLKLVGIDDIFIYHAMKRSHTVSSHRIC